jgi:hypothetical protein
MFGLRVVWNVLGALGVKQATVLCRKCFIWQKIESEGHVFLLMILMKVILPGRSAPHDAIPHKHNPLVSSLNGRYPNLKRTDKRGRFFRNATLVTATCEAMQHHGDRRALSLYLPCRVFTLRPFWLSFKAASLWTLDIRAYVYCRDKRIYVQPNYLTQQTSGV